MTISSIEASGSDTAKDLMSKVMDLNTSQDIKEELINSISPLMSPITVNCVEAKIFTRTVSLKNGQLEKTITHADFLQLLTESMGARSVLSAFQLPYGCYYLAQSANRLNLGLYHAERDADLVHEGTTYHTRIPNIIISITLCKEAEVWIVEKVSYWATNRTVPQLPEDSLVETPRSSEGRWNMPMTNFYPEGHMCYGNNGMPVRFKTNLRGLDYYYQVITNSPFNNDLFPVSVSSRDYPTIGRWFDSVPAGQPYPYDKLL